jgi:long-chain acyl-CoA synthetase
MSLKRIIDILPHIQESYHRADTLVAKRKGNWIPISIDEMINEVEMLSFGLMNAGILPNDKVAIISPNCPEWNIADFAIANIGAVSVPVYPTMSPSESAFILNDATVKVVFVADKELYQKITALKNETPSVELILTFQEIEGLPNYKSIQKTGDDAQKKLLQQYKDSIKPEDLLTLIYTSGTTGTPKGVMLSHNNLVSNLIAAREVCPVRNEHKVLSFLPLSHIFERMLVYLYLYVGAGIYYAESLETIGDNLKEVKPFAFSTVPRLLEKVYAKIVAKGNELSGIKRALFFWALDLGDTN